jgi:hypothetical protein
MTTNWLKRAALILLSALLLSAASLPAAHAIQKEDKDKKEKKAKAPIQKGTPVLWRDPGEVEQLDFVGGPGGRQRAPKPPFTFVEENLSGSNPKVRVTDANGVKWAVKFGSEVNAESFATRLLWATGYFVEPNYYVASGVIQGARGLKRARKAIAEDGRFVDARFELPRPQGVRQLDEKDSWGWLTNPFVGTKELNGLKVMVMLLSNWDNKDVRDVSRGSNTVIFQTPTDGGVEDRYFISDWGGSMGKTGGYFSREKWDCRGFRDQTPKFVKGVQGDTVQFSYGGQHTQDFMEGIRTSDVRWLLRYLGRITDNQIRMGLEASGATPDEVACFTQSLRDRINQLKAVAR